MKTVRNDRNGLKICDFGEKLTIVFWEEIVYNDYNKIDPIIQLG